MKRTWNSDTNVHSSAKRIKVEHDRQDSGRYEYKDDRQHVLDLSDTYIGSVRETIIPDAWVMKSKSVHLEQRTIRIIPGLYKIFDEILVNAADNLTRTRQERSTHPTTCIQVDIHPEENKISIWNNGQGLPILQHHVTKEWIPCMVFGMMRTSGNYKKNEKRIVGGKNGLGSKLTNLFSTRFEIETVDVTRKRRLKQVWMNNMSPPQHPPEISEEYSGEPYTKVTFWPDLSRFGLSNLTRDNLDLMRKRVLDIAVTSQASVYLNSIALQTGTFFQHIQQEYLNAYPDIKVACYEQNRWQVLACVSPHGVEQQVSYVNHLCTLYGGKHVQYVADDIASRLAKRVKHVKKNHIRNNLWLFVNCFIENPGFDSQTKTRLTTPPKEFGSSCKVPDTFIDTLFKSKVIERALALRQAHDKTALNKTDGKKSRQITGIEKFDDAHWAGTKKSQECILILTEGDSASSFALSAMEILGRERYGIYALRGKPLNVAKRPAKQVADNREITNLKKILGLKQGQVYTDVKQLRYGQVQILSDQDPDGSHIKGLIINFLGYYWPDLLKHGQFVSSLYTPVVKIWKGKRLLHEFYCLRDYKEWQKTCDEKGLKIKYYKGLGTSSDQEAIECFRKKMSVQYEYDDEAPKSLELAFGKHQEDARKQWLNHVDWEAAESMDYSKKSVTISEFVHKDLILFSEHSNRRAIPGLLDGLKPSQRKALYGMITLNQTQEEKVSILTGKIMGLTAYHAGEASMQKTIVAMANDFVGANNVNYFVPAAQFGSRRMGGADAASARYIFTYLHPIVKYLFRAEDACNLVSSYDDGYAVEPCTYLPVMCTTLLNGAHGLGTGYATHIPNFHPLNIIHNIRQLLYDQPLKPMKPWYRHFQGTIEAGKSSWISRGTWSICGNKVQITELPVGVWTESYKKHLEHLLTVKKIQGFQAETCSKQHVRFTVTLKEEHPQSEQLSNVLHLSEAKMCHTGNMVLYNPIGKLEHYECPEDILRIFTRVRFLYYVRRREYMIHHLRKEVLFYQERTRFVQDMMKHVQDIAQKPVKQVISWLQEKGYRSNPLHTRIHVAPISNSVWKQASDLEQSMNLNAFQEPDNYPEIPDDIQDMDYDYLLSMPIKNVTYEEMERLHTKQVQAQSKLSYYVKNKARDLWCHELDELTVQLKEHGFV